MRVAATLAAGGRLLDESENRWRVADPEGNEMAVNERCMSAGISIEPQGDRPAVQCWSGGFVHGEGVAVGSRKANIAGMTGQAGHAG